MNSLNGKTDKERNSMTIYPNPQLKRSRWVDLNGEWDFEIKDLKDYTRSLVFEDPALKREIEEFLKKMANNQQQKQDKKEAEEKGLDYVEVTDEDILAYNQELERQKQQDKESELNESTNPPLD